jgi:hypothetical protein
MVIFIGLVSGIASCWKTLGAPTHAILITQYRVCAVITDGVGAVLKFCAKIEETLSEFEIQGVTE